MRIIILICAIALGRLSYFFIKAFNIGYGSSFPGFLARLICPEIFKNLTHKIKNKIIYVTGTNGKTTTTGFLATLFAQENTVYNASGANLEAGIITALLKRTNCFGKLNVDHAIFEIDEQTLPHLLKKRAPDLLICLNLFRDQLDRYGEIEVIKNAWKKAMKELPGSTRFLLNGDDPLLVYLSKELERPVYFFGLNEVDLAMKKFSYAIDSAYCSSCSIPLEYRNIYLAHLGDYFCKECHFERGCSMQDSRKWAVLFSQIHNKYNSMAAICAALLLGKKEDEIKETLNDFSPAFGRGEKILIDERNILFLLSKNPSSLNVSISYAKELKEKGELGGIVLALNDEVADGKDISWIWDAEIRDLCLLSNLFFISGKRAHEMALCLTYFFENDSCPSLFLETNLKVMIKKAIDAIPAGKTLCVMPTYTAMLQLREELVGRKIL
jgi:lipid II isoglutaminyl synthase (glutamine-hydrolysing)